MPHDHLAIIFSSHLICKTTENTHPSEPDAPNTIYLLLCSIFLRVPTILSSRVKTVYVMSMQTLYDACYKLVQDSVIQKKTRSFHYSNLCYKNMNDENENAPAPETSILRRSTRIKELDIHLSQIMNI